VALKELKFFSILVILLALFLTACNAQSSQETSTELPSSAAQTPDPCSAANISDSAAPILAGMAEFDDASDLAANTPHEQLTGPISDLQAIRRAAEDYEVPDCLVPLKIAQIDYMNSVIDTMLMFLSMEQEEVIMVGIEITDELRALYENTATSILGETP